MYSIVNSFWDEVTDVSVRVTMRGDSTSFEEEETLLDLWDTFDVLETEEDFEL